MRRIGVATAIRIVYVALSVVAGIVVARLGGADAKGVVATYSAASAMFFVIANFDLAGQFIRHARISEDPGSAFPALLRTWLLYGVALVVCGFAAIALDTGLLPMLLAGAAYLVATQAATVCRGLAGPVAAASQSVIQPTVMILATVFLWVSGRLTIESVVWALVLSFLAPALVSVFLIMRARAKLPTTRKRARLLLRSMVNDGLRWQPARIAQFAVTRVGTVGVFYISGATAAGVYSVGVSSAEFAGLIATQHAVDLQHRATMGDVVNTRATAFLALRATLLSALLLAASGWFLLTPLYGAEFSNSRFVLVAAIPGVLATSVVLIHTTGRYFTEGPRRVTVCALAGLAVTLIALYPAGAAFGAVGIAAAASLGAIVNAVMLATRPPGKGSAPGFVESRD